MNHSSSRILISGKLAPIALERFAREPGVEVVYRPDLPAHELLALIGDFDALITRSETQVDRTLIDRGSRLRVIARAAVGINNIDVECATERGILVINTPGMNTNSAAELTLGLLLAVMRRIISAHGTMSESGWDRHKFSGFELRGKTIGIIGLGNVGHRVARFAKGFDMRVLAYDPYIARALFERHGAEPVDLETLCRQSDVVTVHVPKTKETSGMIGARQIEWMKEGVVLLNAARGGIISEAALLEALRSGKVAGAGLDTWEKEPPPDNPFRYLKNVVMTPHIGASTKEAQDAIGATVAEQTLKALRGEVVDYPINMPQIRILEGSPARHYTVLAERLGSFAAQYIDFAPTKLEVFHRGGLSEDDAALCRLAFLKGYLQHSNEELITYVNAERKASGRGLSHSTSSDHVYQVYESSLRFILRSPTAGFQIAGVVFGGHHQRLTLINEYVIEMEPKGHFLITVNRDQPGMIGLIGTLLGGRGVNIDQFELARNRQGGEALALIRTDDRVPEDVLSALHSRDGILAARPISLV